MLTVSRKYQPMDIAGKRQDRRGSRKSAVISTLSLTLLDRRDEAAGLLSEKP
jgi:hypothetical protein